jgi:hypothetical protein
MATKRKSSETEGARMATEERVSQAISDIVLVRVNDHIGKFLRGYEAFPLPLMIEQFSDAIGEDPATAVLVPNTCAVAAIVR